MDTSSSFTNLPFLGTEVKSVPNPKLKGTFAELDLDFAYPFPVKTL